MNVRDRLVHLPLHPEPIDAWLSKWGSMAGGLLIVALTPAGLRSQGVGAAEFALGVGLASLACLNLALFGVLARQVHLAWHRGAAPWRARVGEFVGLGIGLGIIAAGFPCMASLALAPAGLLVGWLLVLSTAIAVMSLGLWSTLSRAV